jgi:hypothetical protein
VEAFRLCLYLAMPVFSVMLYNQPAVSKRMEARVRGGQTQSDPLLLLPPQRSHADWSCVCCSLSQFRPASELEAAAAGGLRFDAVHADIMRSLQQQQDGRMQRPAGSAQ